MARYLQKPCVGVVLKTVQISRKERDEVSGLYQSYVVLLGEAIDEDGVNLGSFHKKVNLGPPSEGHWDEDTAERDVEAVAALVKATLQEVHNAHTIE